MYHVVTPKLYQTVSEFIVYAVGSSRCRLRAVRWVSTAVGRGTVGVRSGLPLRTEWHSVRSVHSGCTVPVLVGVRSVYAIVCCRYRSVYAVVCSLINTCCIRRPVSGWCCPAEYSSPRLSRLGITVLYAGQQPLRHVLRCLVFLGRNTKPVPVWSVSLDEDQTPNLRLLLIRLRLS